MTINGIQAVPFTPKVLFWNKEAWNREKQANPGLPGKWPSCCCHWRLWWFHVKSSRIVVVAAESLPVLCPRFTCWKFKYCIFLRRSFWSRSGHWNSGHNGSTWDSAHSYQEHETRSWRWSGTSTCCRAVLSSVVLTNHLDTLQHGDLISISMGMMHVATSL